MGDHGPENGNGMTGAAAQPLRLRATDAADLEILATLLQDAILPGNDMQYDPAANRFVMVVNRFCWERDPLEGVSRETGGAVYERSLCGVQFHHVTKVWQTAMPSDRKGSLFNILTVKLGADDDSADGVLLDILFSGGGAIRLKAQQLEIMAEDIEAARPSMVQPDHGEA